MAGPLFYLVERAVLIDERTFPASERFLTNHTNTRATRRVGMQMAESEQRRNKPAVMKMATCLDTCFCIPRSGPQRSDTVRDKSCRRDLWRITKNSPRCNRELK
jgi:hypothetical protein